MLWPDSILNLKGLYPPTSFNRSYPRVYDDYPVYNIYRKFGIWTILSGTA